TTKRRSEAAERDAAQQQQQQRSGTRQWPPTSIGATNPRRSHGQNNFFADRGWLPSKGQMAIRRTMSRCRNFGEQETPKKYGDDFSDATESGRTCPENATDDGYCSQCCHFSERKIVAAEYLGMYEPASRDMGLKLKTIMLKNFRHQAFLEYQQQSTLQDGS
ncbi:hypothetical protein BV898_18466, partial [Hypsibius exemplaris]